MAPLSSIAKYIVGGTTNIHGVQGTLSTVALVVAPSNTDRTALVPVGTVCLPAPSARRIITSSLLSHLYLLN